LAAINAGFFRLDNSIFVGDAAGALMIDGEMYSEAANDRIALLVSNKKEATKVSIQYLTNYFIGVDIKGRKDFVGFSGVNRERKENEMIIYTPVFHRTTLTGSAGAEIIVENNRVIRIVSNGGNSIIPPNGFVLSANETRSSEMLGLLKIGTRISLVPPHFMRASHLDAEDIVAGVPQLIKDGKIDITWEKEKSSKAFVETRHPRTAVAKLKDGKFLMITIDGRSEASGGIGLQDLAEYLLSLGAVDAMNLDGGGSTTMFLDGKVVNHPSDKEGERKVSDALIVTSQKR
jgi:exopolysaccharide biosynthesis protein